MDLTGDRTGVSGFGTWVQGEEDARRKDWQPLGRARPNELRSFLIYDFGADDEDEGSVCTIESGLSDHDLLTVLQVE